MLPISFSVIKQQNKTKQKKLVPSDMKCKKFGSHYSGNSKVYMERQRPRMEDRVRGPGIPNCKTYKAPAIKMELHRWQNRQMDQWNRTECPEIESHIYSQLFSDKEAKATNGARTSGWKKNLDTNLTLFTKWNYCIYIIPITFTE